MKITCVCGKCKAIAKDEDVGTFEIDFNSKTIHFVCPSCQKDNKIVLEKPLAPLPKIRLV